MVEKMELNLDQMEQVTGGVIKPYHEYPGLKDRSGPTGMRWLKYLVRDGDTLWALRKRFNCLVNDIKKWNNLKSERLEPGMVLDLYTDRN